MKRGYTIVRQDKTGLDPTKTPTPIDIAWAAGIFEGEGSCNAGGHDKKSFSAVVSQKDPELLYRLRDLFGGGIHQYNVGDQNRFEVFHWTCCGDRGRVFLASIYPFLTARRKAQIDATRVREFLDIATDLISQKKDVAPCPIYAALWTRLEEFVAEQRQKAKEHTKQRLAEFDKARRSDPQKVAKRNAARRKLRELRRQNQQSGNVIQIEKTA
jgi:hypothetical protein